MTHTNMRTAFGTLRRVRVTVVMTSPDNEELQCDGRFARFSIASELDCGERKQDLDARRARNSPPYPYA